MATTDDAEFARAVAFERSAHAEVCGRVERLRDGFAFLDDSLPLVYYANLLWITATDRGLRADELVADAERLLAPYEHRWIVVEHEPLWRALEYDFLAAGWGLETVVYMSHRRPPDRLGDLAAAREVDRADILPAEQRYLATQPWAAKPDSVRQVIEHHRRIGELLGERCFAAFAGGGVCAFAKLRARDRVAQIEDVAVLQEHRGGGLGRLVTSAALAAAVALEPELLFIVADDADWPQELYGRLGFEPVGRLRAYHRLPPT